jgi:NitT/TauT family transport system substrate-binding protein
MEKGFFRERGVDITGILTSTGGGTSVRNTLAGDLPFGEVALPAAIEAIKAGQPVKIVCAGVESVADILWIAKPDSPLSSIKDIVGKKIGYTSPGSVTNMLILMAMKAQGIDASSVTLVPAGGIGANLTAVLSGAIDAGMTSEPVWSQEKSKVKPVFWTKDVLPPDMTQTVGIVTDELAKAGPEKIRAIIEGRREGVKFIAAHPDEAADIVAKTYGTLDPALTREVFRHFLEIKYWSEGALNYAAMDRMMEGLKIVGKLKEPVDWQKVTDVSFLPQDLQVRTH